ncbi:MAG: radical SAM family heme chaperone HemW [Rickettsiales bacterium]
MKQTSIYIHWPFCLSKCPYCDFNSHVYQTIDEERWGNAIISEMEYMRRYTHDAVINSIFFGGGTPSLMSAKTVESVILSAHRLWKVNSGIEITLEANPTSVESGKFMDFSRAGVNRLSMGVQSLLDRELKFLGRQHSAKEAIKAIEVARNIFNRYSFDLIYARPNQTLDDWRKELEEALSFAGGHLSLYQLTIENNTAFYNIYHNGGFSLPDEDTAEKLYRLTEDIMNKNGFVSYEVSNYAKDGEESIHNLNYWQGGDYIGIGAGAHGRITIEGRRVATSNIKSPNRWLDSVEKNNNALDLWETLSVREEIEERLMMGLRLADGMNYKDFITMTGYDICDYINMDKKEFYTKEGLLENNKESLVVTKNGRLLLNSIISELLI